MEEPKIKRRRTSTKHSQTGCKTCKTRHIKCDETRPRCMNCEKGDRICVFASRSPSQQNPSPLPPTEPPPITSSIPYFTDPFAFRPTPSHTPNLPASEPAQAQHYGASFEDIYGASQPSSQPFEATGQFGSRRSSTPSSASITPSPHIRHPTGTTSSALVRNAVLVNNVQSQSMLHQAIHSFSEDFRLRGQPFTIESILSPIIYRSNSLKFAVFANFILQADQVKRSPSSSPLQHERYYNNAITHLQTTLNDPHHLDSNIGTLLWLAFYNICRGDSGTWNLNMRSAADQIRLRGTTLDTHPLSMHTKFLFSLWIRADIMVSNATGTPANFDRDIARIAYSGVPVSNKLLLPSRIDLEMLLAEISLFQFECANPLPIGGAWHYSAADLHRKYEDLLNRLGRWQAATSELIAFEEAQPGEYHHGAMLPPEMGLPLLSNDQEVAQLWSLHCTAVLHLHSIASKHHLISHIPEQAPEIAILYCRILSGMSIINPAEPSVTDLWPLAIMSWALDFASGKMWVAEQLQSIATRYLNRSASIVARKVQQATIHDEDPTTTLLTRIDVPPPVGPSQGKLVMPDLHSPWPTSGPSTGDDTLYHTYIAPGEKMAPPSGSINDPSRAYFPE